MKKNTERRSDIREVHRRGWPTWEWLVLRVITPLGFTVFSLSPAAVGQTQTQPPKPTILVFNYSQASQKTIRTAEAEASQIFGKAGFPAV